MAATSDVRKPPDGDAALGIIAKGLYGRPSTEAFAAPIERLRKTESKNVMEVASAQLELSTAYYQEVLNQSNRSFFWALIGSGTGLVLFAFAVGSSLLNSLSIASIVPLIAGAVVEVISGVVFYLYGKTTIQLSAFHSRLEVLQRYMIANSVCDSLDDDTRNKARSALVHEISRGPIGQTVAVDSSPSFRGNRASIAPPRRARARSSEPPGSRTGTSTDLETS